MNTMAHLKNQHGSFPLIQSTASVTRIEGSDADLIVVKTKISFANGAEFIGVEVSSENYQAALADSIKKAIIATGIPLRAKKKRAAKEATVQATKAGGNGGGAGRPESVAPAAEKAEASVAVEVGGNEKGNGHEEGDEQRQSPAYKTQLDAIAELAKELKYGPEKLDELCVEAVGRKVGELDSKTATEFIKQLRAYLPTEG